LAESTTDAYASICSRTIIIPELAIPFTITALDTVPATPADIDPGAADELLRSEIPSLLNIPESSILTFTRWSEIHGEVNAILGNPRFESEMSRAYGGADEEAGKEFATWLTRSRAALDTRAREIGEPARFAELIARKILLDPRREDLERRPPVFAYGGLPIVEHSVYADLSDRGISDIELLRWNQISGALGRPSLPSVTGAWENIQSYEIALPGSPSITSLSLQQFVSRCRGAAFVVLSATALAAATGLQGSWIALAVLVAKGSAVTLGFITVGQLAQVIEGPLFAKHKSKRTTTKRGT
jgi:hypothetical protein